MAGIYVPWLADAARLTGFPVVEVAGWRARGHSGYRVLEGVVAHHTAGPATGEYPSLGVVRDGRPGLAGPLSGLGIGRSGTIYVIAAGVSWHAGASRWGGFTDLNDEFIGIEAESSGTGDWTAAQREVYPRLCAALLYYMRRDASRIGAHREVALPAGRKPDPVGIDMPSMRAQVATMLADPLRRIPRGGAAPSAPPSSAPSSARKAVLADMPSFTWPAGPGAHKIVYPVGSMSQVVSRAWISFACDGELRSLDVWFQGDSGGISEVHPKALAPNKRPWFEIPSGTTQMTVHYVSTGPVGCTIEALPK